MDYWRIAALIGTLIFLFSAFVPLVSYIISFSLSDYYGLQTGIQQWGVEKWTMPKGLEGLFITMLLYPITLILGFAATLKRGFTLAAGSLGIVCWLSAFATILYFKNSLDPRFSLIIQYGSGIFLGLLGAIILLVSFFLKSRSRQDQTPFRPQPPSAQTIQTQERLFCCFCGVENQKDAVFCQNCGRKIA